ncbi:MAG: translation initiation factor IF-2 [Phycisphaerae bacterium]|nr:translation initiation factor IF-2 [Phycisphaerae bacterium]
MAKQRIFELAQELGVASKVVLTKCRAEGLDVKNHMSTVSAGLAATICEWFSEGSATSTAVETTEHVDLDKVRADAKKVRHKRTRKKAKAEAEEAHAEVATETAAQAVAEAPGEAVAEAEAPPEQAAEAAVPETPAEAPAPVKEAPAEQEQAEEEIVPAGPQVVPKPVKLKGPRVVRVERPESVEVPRPRRRVAQAPAEPVVQPGSLPETKRGRVGTAAPKEAEGKKGKRRSPRRRGRSAESGESIKEWRETDLAERSQRLASAGGGLRRHRANVSRGVSGMPVIRRDGPVDIEEPITVKSLSEATGIKSAEIIRKLVEHGVTATVNQVIAREEVETVAADYGLDLVVQVANSPEDRLIEQFETREVGQLQPRAPVVTFLGHVDHGKTSLLDRIRDTAVAEGEAGGITQHIGAYRYDHNGKHVVFLDTPGHEAFTAMRARGANMTDVVVLVIAADDGIMPQTVEAINHAKAAGAPVVVALNKIDLPNANVQRVLGQLADNGIQVRQWGGQVELVETSANTGQGIDSLIETLSLEAEILELKAETDAPATGYVIEAQMDPGRGVVASLLVRNGTLHLGEVVVAGRGYGRLRQMIDSHGRNVAEAGPSTPVEIAGLDDVPEAGDKFYAVESIEMARQVADQLKQRARTKSLATAGPATLESLLSQIEAGQVNQIPLIIKADVQGSVEALFGAIEKLATDEVRVNVLHSGVGGISTGDVTLAEASKAIIIGFNVVPDSAARVLAKDKGIDVRLYRVIYDVIEDVSKVLAEGLAPEIREEMLGRAQVRQVFRVSRVGMVAGCYVTEGLVTRSAKVRIIRDNVVVEDERTVESLKRFKDDAREVRSDMECGVKIAGYDDIKEGDLLEFYQQTEVARTL